MNCMEKLVCETLRFLRLINPNLAYSGLGKNRRCRYLIFSAIKIWSRLSGKDLPTDSAINNLNNAHLHKMKLLATALALSAGQALAHTDYSVYIPFDCYSEDDNMYGNPDGSKVSDYLTMTGLDAYAHQLSQVTACVNRETGLLSGVTTSWAKWNNGV